MYFFKSYVRIIDKCQTILSLSLYDIIKKYNNLSYCWSESWFDCKMDLKQFLIFAILACAVRESSAKLLWVTLLLLKVNKPGTCLNRHRNGARGFLGNYPAFEGCIWWRVVGTTSLGWVVLYKSKFFYIKGSSLAGKFFGIYIQPSLSIRPSIRPL